MLVVAAFVVQLPAEPVAVELVAVELVAVVLAELVAPVQQPVVVLAG